MEGKERSDVCCHLGVFTKLPPRPPAVRPAPADQDDSADTCPVGGAARAAQGTRSPQLRPPGLPVAGLSGAAARSLHNERSRVCL